MKMTPTEAAIKSGAAATYVYLLLRTGQLQGTRVDGRWLIDAAVFEEWNRGYQLRRKQKTSPERA